MNLPKSFTTVTTFSKILAALLFILFPLIGFRIGMLYQKNIDNLASTHTDEKVQNSIVQATPIPTIKPLVLPKSSSEIVWLTYNYVVDKDAAFSFKFPDVGDYCNGCFDGWPYNTGKSNVGGVWITGSYYRDSENRDWSLTVGNYYPNLKENDVEFINKEIPKMISDLSPLNIGESVDISYVHSETVRATRGQDVRVMNKLAQEYFINDKKHFLVLIKEPKYTTIITYEYTSPIYDVFDKILSSFSPDLVESPRSGMTFQEYEAYKLKN